MKSFKVEVNLVSEPGWHSNALRFATEEEAAGYATELLGRWKLVHQTRVVETSEPANQQWADGKISRLQRRHILEGYRFYVLAAAMPQGYPMFTSRSPEPVAHFEHFNDAQWVCNKLNNCAQLHRAVTALMSSEVWRGVEKRLAEDILDAANQYKRDE